jgi:parallel beta-helix repeat protein
MKKSLALIVGGIIFTICAASAAVFTVTNVNDNGPGSLRQAILDANASPGADTINFNLPASGVQTIAPTNALPDITNTVAINGYSQPGSSANSLANGDNAVLLVRLDGVNLTGFPNGLSFKNANGNTVRGLIIVRFYYGIQLSVSSENTIAGNWIGLDADGIARVPGGSSAGVYVTCAVFNSSTGNIIGGLNPADRNVIAGHWFGVTFSPKTAANNSVLGNFIGTDATGTLPRGNLFCGVQILSATNITIGGTSPSACNVIAGCTAAGGSGIFIQSSSGDVIQGNYIGTDVSGQYDLGNISDGVYVTSSQNTRITGNEIVNNRANGINLASSSGTVMENNFIGTDASATRPLGNAMAGITITGSTNRVGGLSAGQANTIQFNGGAGVEVTSTTAVQDEISGNSIYDNGGLGIDLYPAGINTNDVLDADTGANGLQNYPVLTNASIAFSALAVQGTFNSKASATYRLEFFATPAWDPTNTPEGKIFLGATNVTTDGSGNAGFNAAFATAPATNLLVTATATDANGNTSEFSAGIGIVTNGVASPSLAVAKSVSGSGGSATTTTTVAWPSAASFFALEKTGSLNPPVQWQAVTSGIADSGGTKTFSITNGGANTNQFFRLKKP